MSSKRLSHIGFLLVLFVSIVSTANDFVEESIKSLKNDQYVDLSLWSTAHAKTQNNLRLYESSLYDIALAIRNIPKNTQTQTALSWLEKYQPQLTKAHLDLGKDVQVPVFDLAKAVMSTKNSIIQSAMRQKVLHGIKAGDFEQIVVQFHTAEPAQKAGLISGIAQSTILLDDFAMYLLKQKKITTLAALTASKTSNEKLAVHVVTGENSYAATRMLAYLPSGFDQQQLIKIFEAALGNSRIAALVPDAAKRSVISEAQLKRLLLSWKDHKFAGSSAKLVYQLHVGEKL